MRLYPILFILLYWLIGFTTASAQRFPIDVSVQAISPSPVYLSNYANQSATTSPLRVQLLLNDLSITRREIKVKASFSGNGIRFENIDFPVGVAPIFIEGGVPLQLTNVEIAPLFEFRNIRGITAEIYGSSLPEGNYQFCFQVFDAITNRQLSSVVCTNVFIFENDPPLLVLPTRDATINAVTDQNIIFQWTPRHRNVSNVVYELNIVEIWDRSVNPQTAFFSLPPVFTTTVNNTSFRYGPAQPQLLSNRRYAWQVQAKAVQGAESVGFFKNNGFSEVFWFDYTVPCNTPTNISHEVKGQFKTNLYWDADVDVLSYTLRYREANSPNAEWFESRTREDWLTLWDLKAETKYEYQLKSTCELGESDFSISNYFTTNGEEDEDAYYNCGIPSDITLSNKTPIEEIYVDEVFMAGDFPIRIKSIAASSGRYTGTGLVNFPYLKNAGIKVKFSNILINSDKELAEGVVVTTYDSELKGIVDIDEAIDSVKNTVKEIKDLAEDVGDIIKGGDTNTVQVDFEVADVVIDKEKGVIVITGTNGETQEIDYDEEDKYEISGPGGKVFSIDNEVGGGQPQEEGEVAEGGAPTSQNTGGLKQGTLNGSDNSGEGTSVAQIASDKVTVSFKTGTLTQYGFEEANNNYERNHPAYPKTTDASGNDVYLVHKAVPQGQTDVFYADITFLDSTIQPTDIIIKTVGTGRNIESNFQDNTLAITVEGFNGYQREEAIITYKNAEDNQQVIASFFIHHLRTQNNVKLNLVPLSTTANVTAFEQQVQNIYTKAGISFDLQTLPAYNPSTSVWDKDDNKQLTYDGSGSFTNLPNEFKAVIRDYQKSSNFDQNAYYIFVTDLPTSNPLGGFMPRGSQFGFVFTGGKGDEAKANNTSATIAHEVGHGLFGLEHPFKGTDTKNSGTDWLMDYNQGTQLSVVDWAQLGNEAINLSPLNVFQDDEDNQSAIFKFRPNKDFTVNIDKRDYFQFLSPAGEVVNIAYDKFVSGIFYFGMEGDLHEYVLPSTLIGFTIYENEETLKYTLKTTGAQSLGYFDTQGNPFKPTTKALKDKNVLIGYASDNNDFAIAKHKYINAIEYGADKKLLVFNDDIDFYPNLSTGNYLSIQRFSDKRLVGNLQNQITPEYRETLNEHYKSDEFLSVLKIAEWRSRYPELFKKFTTTFDRWNSQNLILNTEKVNVGTTVAGMSANNQYEYYGVWNEEMGKDNNLLKLYNGTGQQKVAFYRAFLKGFRDFIEKPSAETRECFEDSDMNSIAANELLKCIKNASQDELRDKISQSNRQLAIKKILAETWVSDDYEKAIVKLFTYTPKNFDEDLFFDFFENDCNISVRGKRNGAKGLTITKCLWSILFESVDDGAFLISNDTNRKDLMLSILSAFYKSKRYTDEVELIDAARDNNSDLLKERTFYFDYENIIVRIFANKYESLETGVSSSSQLFIKQINSSNDREVYYSPFKLAYIVNKSYLENGSPFKRSDNSGLPGVMPVPAIILHYLSQDATIKTTTDVIVTSLDVASLLATGTPASQMAKLLFYADRISSVASIATTAIDNDDSELSQILNGLSTVLGVADLTNLSVEGLRKLTTTNKYNSLSRAEAITEVNKLSKQINKFDNPEGQVLLKKLYVSETDDGLLALEKTLEDNLNTLDITDLAKRTEIEQAIATIKKTKTSIGVTGVSTLNLADNLLVLKDVKKHNFTETFINETFFKLFDESPIVSKLNTATKKELQNEALKYYLENTNEGYKKLYDLFLENKINIDRATGKPWPPFDGFVKIDETLKGGEITKVLDRFQTPYKQESVESLRGGFASPVFSSKYQDVEVPLPFTYESRALLTNLEENLVYINFRFFPNADVRVKVGKSMPWGSSNGNAIQYKLNKNFVKLEKGYDYQIIEKLIFKKGKWRKIPDNFEDYGKKVDDILEKITCP